MVRIHPFRGIRPDESLVEKIATLPYDVLNSQEARDLAKDNPYSYLHIDKAEIDLSQELSPYADEVYQKAAENLKTFLANEWLVKDQTENLYLYELTMNDRSQTGLVTCTAIADYKNGKIKKHEYTRPEKELDRINHSDTCDANTSPIFLTYRQEKTIQQLMDNWKQTHQPIYNFNSFHNVDHKVWLIDDAEIIQKLVNSFEQNVPALYIADGHHRTESAVKVGLKRQQEFPEADQEAEFNYFLSVIFPKEELAIWDYNRVLNVPISNDFLTKMKTYFEVEAVTAGKPAQPKHFGMYLDHQWYQLKIKPEYIPEDPVEKLDVSLLQHLVFEKEFGITDIRTDKRIDFVGGIRGMDELVRLVDSGDWTIAFALYPTTMDDLLSVADAGKIMPPKSTWFEPKLLSGLFLHDLETKNK